MSDPPADLGTFDTLEQLDVLAASPFRIQMLEHFREPSTVKAAAERLDVPVTRLYYHVNLLVDHGFLRVAEERQVGGLTERFFVLTAEGFHPSEAFLDRYGAEGTMEAVRLVLRAAEAGFEAAADHGLLDGRPEAIGTLGLSQIRLTPDRRREFLERLNELLEEYDDDPDGEPMWRLVAVLPRWGRGS